MIFPIEKLIKYTGNIYEITCAANRRAFQLSMMHDRNDIGDVINENDGKVVSVAARQLFYNDVQYRIEA
jgi:DNA-directed RNA polymerase subunit omega